MTIHQDLTREEAVQAAKDGRLWEAGDHEKCWFECDGKHVGLRPIADLIGEGVLAYKLCHIGVKRRPIVVR